MHSVRSAAASAPLTLDAPGAARWRERRQHFAAADSSTQATLLASAARSVRADIVRTIESAGLGHVGGDLSVTDILVTLFEAVLRIDPSQPAWVGWLARLPAPPASLNRTNCGGSG